VREKRLAEALGSTLDIWRKCVNKTVILIRA